jgi:hypothetical protein
MELAFGVLNMSPNDFWGQTMIEWNCRVRGYQKANTKQEAEPELKSFKAFAKQHNAQLRDR